MTRTLAAMLLVAVCGTAAAQTVTVTNEAGQTETTPAEQAAPPEQAGAASADNVATTCLRSTGSRIVSVRNLRAEREGKPQQCANAPGRVYTREDLDRSGYVDIAEALRALDTSIR